MSPKPRGRSAAIRLARLVLVICGCAWFAAPAQFLDPARQQKIRAATFEVVMLKPADDSIAYEKPLPMDLLPYQFRNDKYFSVGTAFAIGEHRYVTAAHVLGLGIASLWGTPALRDGGGKVYAIDKVLKYSTAQDFAVFSVVDEPATAPYEIGAHPALNETVYAVGNALGDGVVIRDGLYTSDTPEERDGKWKWLRFSAAASPGNSGGPLLDKDGKVIGVVLRKSPNENLNYALSIDEVLAAKADTASIDVRQTYQLDVFDFKQTETLKKDFALPRSYADFSRAYLEIWNAFDDKILDDLLKNNADNVFPRGEGSVELLHSLQAGDEPGLVVRGQDGTWGVRRAGLGRRSDLGHNGYVALGRIANLAMMKLRRPDDVAPAPFYSDSRLYMDMLLKGQPLYRSMGPESIKVTSLGKAVDDAVFADAWGRKWQLRQWPLPFQNAVLMSMALPVPEGYIVLGRTVGAGSVHDNLNDFKALADFVAVSYGGTLAQWRDFLRQEKLLPDAFEHIELKFDYGKSLAYSSPRSAFSYTPALQKISAASELTLDFGYFSDRGRPVWDVMRVKSDEDAHNNSFVSIARNPEPAASMDDQAKSRWAKLSHRQHPYDGVITTDGDLTSIRGVHEPANKPSGEEGVLYSVWVQNDGAATQDAMKARLDLVLQGLSVKDDVAPKAPAAQAQD